MLSASFDLVLVNPGEPMTEQERQQLAQYEDWMLHLAQWLGLHVKTYETSVNKLRKTRKALTTKQRQVGER